MKKITPDQYCEGVESIFVEDPDYALGYDGRDHKCDCIGMGRGALTRMGVENVTGMSGTNYAARKTLLDVRKITGTADLKKGDVVLKVRDKDDKSMPLPDRYRKGNKDYDPKWGETNFTHYGTVTSVYPLVITHMTSPKAKKDKSIGSWAYVGRLPWVDYEGQAEDQPMTEWVRVCAESGKTVKMRAKPSTGCSLYWDVPVGAEVQLIEKGETWDRIRWAGQEGYMMNRFLSAGETPGESLVTVVIKGLTREQAEEITAIYGGTIE